MKTQQTNIVQKLEKKDPMKKELLSIPEAAELLSCSTRTVRRLIEERTIEACKLRSSTRVVSASLRGYILTIIGDYQEKNGLAEFKSSGWKSVTVRDRAGPADFPYYPQKWYPLSNTFLLDIPILGHENLILL